jgi:hypothetical protein
LIGLTPFSVSLQPNTAYSTSALRKFCLKRKGQTMFTINSQQLMIHSNYQQQRLRAEAAQARLLQELQAAHQNGHNTGQKNWDNNSRMASAMITWRRLWQHLLVGIGLVAALLLSL